MTSTSEHRARVKKLRLLVADEACWERGTEYAWNCDAITSAWFLSRLTELAAHAPPHEIDNLIAQCAGA